MDSLRPFGLYLFHKEHCQRHVLKDLLQLLRSSNPGKSISFSYVEAETSLVPHLSLWENLDLETSSGPWKEFLQGLDKPFLSLAQILREPNKKANDAEAWEKFALSLLKAFLNKSPHILIDMNEELLSPFMIQNFKKILLTMGERKNIILASANSSLWLDSAHSLVTRKDYTFCIETLDQERVKRHWIA